jgi:predicted signal transduction protein with EAL and GGDEF domain
VSVGVSIGRASFPDGAETFDALVHAADVDMYESKFGQRGDSDTDLRVNQR